MEKKYLKDIYFWDNVSHFSDIRKFTLKDDNGFYFKSNIEFELISESSAIIEMYYKELYKTFNNVRDVFIQYKNDFKKQCCDDLKIYRELIKQVPENELKNYGFDEERIFKLKYFFYFIEIVDNYNKMLESKKQNNIEK